MRRTHISSSLLLLVMAWFCLPFNAVAQTELQQKMKSISHITEIKDLESKRAELDKEIEVYLRELGIVE